MDVDFLKLEIFVPRTHLGDIRLALQAVDAGHIGKYDSCLSYSPVIGCFRPLAGTDPFIGSEGEVCEVEEYKVEVTIRRENLKKTMDAVKKAHPYEEPVINVIALFGVGL